MKLRRWLSNAPLEELSTPRVARIGTSQSTDERRSYNRGQLATPNEREFSVTISVGGISGLNIPWGGTSPEDARNSFLEFMFNHNEFGVSQEEPHRYFRSLYGNFNGKNVFITFRTSWITGFTIS